MRLHSSVERLGACAAETLAPTSGIGNALSDTAYRGRTRHGRSAAQAPGRWRPYGSRIQLYPRR